MKTYDTCCAPKENWPQYRTRRTLLVCFYSGLCKTMTWHAAFPTAKKVPVVQVRLCLKLCIFNLHVVLLSDFLLESIFNNALGMHVLLSDLSCSLASKDLMAFAEP